jgi:hypothetical protein
MLIGYHVAAQGGTSIRYVLEDNGEDDQPEDED